MGLYTFRFPHEFEAKEYAKLIPGKPRYIVLNLAAIGCCSNTKHFGLQAVATSSVSTSCFVSNYSKCPWTNKTEHKSWVTPSPTSGTPSGLWIPCSSISAFTVPAGTNFYQTGDWKDPFQFLMFSLTASEPTSESPSNSASDSEIHVDYEIIEQGKTVDPETGLVITKVRKDLTPPRLESDVYYNAALDLEVQTEQNEAHKTEVAFSMAISFL